MTSNQKSESNSKNSKDETEKIKLECEYCKKTFSTKSNLTTHLQKTKKCIQSRVASSSIPLIYSMPSNNQSSNNDDINIKEDTYTDKVVRTLFAMVSNLTQSNNNLMNELQKLQLSNTLLADTISRKDREYALTFIQLENMFNFMSKQNNNIIELIKSSNESE
jgi:hypothetical protein